MIQSSIDYNSVSKDFLYNGFFSEYLIPSFKLPDSIDFFTIQLNEKSDLVEPLSFNMSRFSENGKRRIILYLQVSFSCLISYLRQRGGRAWCVTGIKGIPVIS